jgi:hypothetical protein
MSDVRTILERGYAGATPSPDGFERMLRRRHRKRRNQRIAGGVVGIVAFVAALWIVTSLGPLGRSDTSPIPGGDVTGPAETGPAETRATVAPETWLTRYYRIPPAGTAVSTPVEGKLIAETSGYADYDGYVVRVYADGRVLSWDWEGPPCVGSSCLGGVSFVERRLSSEGVELVRSGAVQPKDFAGCCARSLPESAWEDRVGKPYVPARYGACFWRIDGGPADVEAVLDLLPPSAQALLSGSNPALNAQCLEVTPEAARSLEEILSQARSSAGGLDKPEYEVGTWSLRDGNGVFISLRPRFPDGRRLFSPGF